MDLADSNSGSSLFNKESSLVYVCNYRILFHLRTQWLDGRLSKRNCRSENMVDQGSPPSQESPHSDDGGNHAGGSGVREQDRFLPIANISRIMKKALPANAKIAKDAKETVQECVSEFISFITSEASDKCQREKRKTINGDDLLWAMSTLGFEDYVEPLKLYLQKFREIEGDKGAVGNKGGVEQPIRKEGSALSGPPAVQMGHSNYYTSAMGGYLQAQMQ